MICEISAENKGFLSFPHVSIAIISDHRESLPIGSLSDVYPPRYLCEREVSDFAGDWVI
jgi:hypothetical protein